MKADSWNKSLFWNLLIAFIVLGAIAWYFKSFDQTAYTVLTLCAGLLLLIALLFHAHYFYIGLIALLPLSLDSNLFGGAQVTLPSEGMLLMLIPVFILFNPRFTATIRKISTHPITILLIIDLVIQTITTLTSSHIDVSLKRLIIKLLFFIGFFITVNALNEKKKLLQVWLAYAIGLLPVIYSTIQNHIHYEFDPKTVFAVSKPFYVDHTLYGACLAFILPILIVLYLYRKKLQWKPWQNNVILFTAMAILVSVMLALSRAALLSLVVALIFALLLKLKVRFTTIVVSLMLLTGLVVSLKGPIYEYLEQNEAVSNDGEIGNHLSSVTNIQSDASNLERVNRWVCAIRMFEEKPLVGFGPGTYQFEYNKFQTLEHKTYISTNSGDKGNAHSEYLTFLSENGIFGAIIFLLTVFGAIYFGMKNHYTVEDPILKIINLGVLLGLVTYFFHGIFNSFMDQSKMAFLYYTGLGTIVWINFISQNANRGLTGGLFQKSH